MMNYDTYSKILGATDEIVDERDAAILKQIVLFFLDGKTFSIRNKTSDDIFIVNTRINNLKSTLSYGGLGICTITTNDFTKVITSDYDLLEVDRKTKKPVTIKDVETSLTTLVDLCSQAEGKCQKCPLGIFNGKDTWNCTIEFVSYKNIIVSKLIKYAVEREETLNHGAGK